MNWRIKLTLWCVVAGAHTLAAAQTSSRTDFHPTSGVTITNRNEAVMNVQVTATWNDGQSMAVSDADGRFTIRLPERQVRIHIAGENIAPQEFVLDPPFANELAITVGFRIPPIHQNLVITASALEPHVQTFSDRVFRYTLFARDDQLVDALNSGINAGQHEGGGKSLEIRRFGFNLDHGGANGGLKVLVDNIQQNQGTQGHGQGYLGALKTLTPELVDDVQVLNGPFTAEYGDFSGLGVVHIRSKERMPDVGTLRLQGGRFGSRRTFMSFSPAWSRSDSLFAYERSRNDGPFVAPLQYKRDNFTANYTRVLNNDQALGFKLNFGRNDFSSSGQLPLDLVTNGELSRFGFLDPSNGGRVRMGTAGIYYRRSLASGDSLKLDAFVSRSLFDLYSNFTLFLNDTERGDAIQQHDSRLQEGFNTQYVHTYSFFGNPALITTGTNYHDNQIAVGLFPSPERKPRGVTSRAHARVTNAAGYAQQGVDLFRGRLHLETGLRWDYFRFRVDDRVDGNRSGTQSASRLQPKLGLTYTPMRTVPMTFTAHYGRGINTQDARGITERPDSPKIATTDFYQVGATVAAGRLSVSGDVFLIDRSNEQVYIPDDGTFELKSPSRSYGHEGKAVLQLSRAVSMSTGLTQVTNSFYRATAPREYVDSAPHTVANASLTLSGWRGLNSSLRYRHVSNYRLDPLDPSIRAAGLDVIDLAVTKSVRPWMDLHIDIDNLTNKSYYETQNYFESRVSPLAEARERIHGTPGYPINLTMGVTFRLGVKEGR